MLEIQRTPFGSGSLEKEIKETVGALYFKKNLKNRRLSQFFPRNLSTRNYQIDEIKSSHPKSCKIIHVDLANNDHVSGLKHSYNQEFTSKSCKIIHLC
jgi:hypothetical protein